MKRDPAVLRSGSSQQPVLVTGGAGFIGCNVADRLAGDGHDVIIFDSLARPGVETNLLWLRDRHPQHIRLVAGDIRDASAVADVAADVQAVFHFAAQVAVTTSLVDPREDFEINAGGTLNLLDALRRRSDPPPFSLHPPTRSTATSQTSLWNSLQTPIARAIRPSATLAFQRTGGSIFIRPMDAPREQPTNMYSISRAASVCRPWSSA